MGETEPEVEARNSSKTRLGTNGTQDGGVFWNALGPAHEEERSCREYEADSDTERINPGVLLPSL